MRTTIRIDDALYREVKEIAARSDRTVAAVLEDALRRGLRVDVAPAAQRYTVAPLGHGGLRPGVDVSSNAAIAETLDSEVGVNALH